MDNRLRDLINKHQIRLDHTREYAVLFKNKRNEKLEIVYSEKAKEEEIILSALKGLKEKIEGEVEKNGSRSM